MKILRHLTHNAGFIAQLTAPYSQVELSLTLTCSSVEKKTLKLCSELQLAAWSMSSLQTPAVSRLFQATA